jgi:hypothetical protein
MRQLLFRLRAIALALRGWLREILLDDAATPSNAPAANGNPIPITAVVNWTATLRKK